MSCKGKVFLSSVVSLGDEIYQILNGDDGHIILKSAKVNENFRIINPTTEAPLNRSKFSCACINSSSFMIFGGDGYGIGLFEIWLFSASNKSWKKLESKSQNLVKRRSAHSVALVQAENKIYAYIFGGSCGIDACSDMLVITITDNKYTCKHIELNETFPSPRHYSTLTNVGQKIWLFGGKSDNGSVCSDLWELDYSFNLLTPAWRRICENGPPGRYAHIAFQKGSEYFIAGGIGHKSKRFNDIWCFSNNSWKQTKIYETDCQVFYCQNVICEIGDTLKMVMQKSPFHALDGLFDELKQAQNEFTEKSISEEGNLKALKDEHSKIRYQIEILEQYGKDHQTNSDIAAIIDEFSEEKKAQLIKETNELKSKISEETREILQMYPLTLKISPLAKSKIHDLAMQFTLKMQESEKRITALIEERKLEVSLCQEQIQTLRGQIPNINNMVRLDPSDFSTFEDFSANMKKGQTEYALNKFYGMQLRIYQHLTSQAQALNSKLAKMEKEKQRRDAVIERLSERLKRKYEKAQQEEIELETWKKYTKEAEEEKNLTQAFIDTVDKYQKDPKSLKEKVQEIEKENTNLEIELNASLMDIVATKKAVIEDFEKKVNDLLTTLKEKPGDCKQLIDAKMPEFQSILNQISRTSTFSIPISK